MFVEERRSLVLKEVNERKSVTVQELTELLGASESTIRRDIVALSREGKLLKVFGGAVALENMEITEELSVLTKETINIEEKRQIAEYAATKILPGDYVYIDSGTTTAQLIRYITEKKATYVTNAVAHARDMARKGLKVLLIGGELKENTEAVVGSDAILYIQKYHFSLGFFGTNGVSLKLGYTTPDVREALVKKVAMMNTRSGYRYVLADHDKFGKSSAVTFSDFTGTKIITNRNPGEIYNKSVEVIVV